MDCIYTLRLWNFSSIFQPVGADEALDMLAIVDAPSHHKIMRDYNDWMVCQRRVKTGYFKRAAGRREIGQHHVRDEKKAAMLGVE